MIIVWKIIHLVKQIMISPWIIYFLIFLQSWSLNINTH